MRDGSELNGVAYLPMNPVGVPITFKDDGNEKKVKIACDSIKTLVYYEKQQTWEYDRMDVFLDESDKKPEQLWVEVSRRGPTTLYKYDHLNRSIGYDSRRVHRHWICIRSAENAARSISSET